MVNARNKVQCDRITQESNMGGRNLTLAMQGATATLKGEIKTEIPVQPCRSLPGP